MMNKENNWKVGLVVGLAVIIVFGVWIGVVTHYTISNISEEQARQFNPIATLLVFILICVALMVIMIVKRNGDEDENLLLR